MSNIKVLDDKLVQQIAAGEVVEGPNSVIKELIENSIDAKSTKIFIKLENAGKDLIQIIDDGSGMSYEDAVICTKRHATSKIKKIEDLFNIHSLGFRGEALASISTVSKFELITNQNDIELGTKIRINYNYENEDNANKTEIEKIACPKGTSIIVKDLFFNTPARKKHLKLTSTELNKIIDIITKYTLANPQIHFKLEHNNKIILNSPSNESLINSIVDIYGANVAKELFEVDYEDDFCKINGFISKPTISRSDKNNVSLFVNGRFVKNKIITDAIYDSYSTVLHNNRYPFAVLKIELNPERLDVNIHPAKTKIKIERENKLYEILFDIIKGKLKNKVFIQDSDINLDKSTQSILKENNSNNNNEASYEENIVKKEPANDINKKIEKDNQESFLKNETNTEKAKINKIQSFERKYDIEDLKQVSLDEVTNNVSDATFSAGILKDAKVENLANNNDELNIKNSFDNEITSSNQNSNSFIVNHGDKKFKIIGQIYNTYIVTETNDGLTLIDQHAADERIIFEKLKHNFEEYGQIKKQNLLSPIKIEINPKERLILEEKKEIISELGFELEHFGSGTYILRSVPVIVGKQQEKEILLDIIDELISFNKMKSIDSIKKKILSVMACRSAIKAGDILTNNQMKELLEKLFKCDFPSNCPHGRPAIIRFGFEEIEKRFKRRGF
jgi:DNA mismatch repair protein MutL